MEGGIEMSFENLTYSELKELGLINETKERDLLIKERFEALRKQGYTVTLAIVAISEDYSRAFDTIRKIVYPSSAR